jgi:F0F1-type ATP synthase membrane subunit a
LAKRDFTCVVMVVSSMYEPTLCWSRATAQPVATTAVTASMAAIVSVLIMMCSCKKKNVTCYETVSLVLSP